MTDPADRILQHQKTLRGCSLCKQMNGPVVMGSPVASPVLLIGQAPGAKEGVLGKPFAWTAGKTLFGWFKTIGLGEEAFRKRVYMAAVCRCFPGKNPKGGDRVPSKTEIANCSGWLRAEMDLLRPKLILPVGKLAISQLLVVEKLKDVVGTSRRLTLTNLTFDVIPLPHPSGASTWHRTEPGKHLLDDALNLIGSHPAWLKVCGERLG